ASPGPNLRAAEVLGTVVVLIEHHELLLVAVDGGGLPGWTKRVPARHGRPDHRTRAHAWRRLSRGGGAHDVPTSVTHSPARPPAHPAAWGSAASALGRPRTGASAGRGTSPSAG